MQIIMEFQCYIRPSEEKIARPRLVGAAFMLFIFEKKASVIFSPAKKSICAQSQSPFFWNKNFN